MFQLFIVYKFHTFSFFTFLQIPLRNAMLNFPPTVRNTDDVMTACRETRVLFRVDEHVLVAGGHTKTLRTESDLSSACVSQKESLKLTSLADGLNLAREAPLDHRLAN